MTNVERLRERIAEAINSEMSCEELSVRTQQLRLERYRRFADAIIAELGLEPQPHPGTEYPLHRWVSDWVADE